VRRSLGALLALASALGAACSGDEPRRVHVLLITVDTLRADRVTAEVMPFLHGLAQREGLLVTHAQTPRAKTTPAMASLMTGLYPHEHGVRDLMQPLGLEHATLAERLRDAGWRTEAVIGNFVLRERYAGLARGFGAWSEELPDTSGVPPEDVPQRRARSLTDAGLAATSAAERPWFVWLHYMDPHGIYDAPAEFRRAPAGAPQPLVVRDPAHPRRHVAEYNVPDEARLADGRIDTAQVAALYDAEARYVDRELERLVGPLVARGDTLVVISADHGESLGEHDYWFEHGRDVYEACNRVPLLIVFPTAERAGTRGRRVDADVSLCDLAPTILEYLRLAPLASPPPGSPGSPGAGDAVRGRSRLAALLGSDERRAAVFCEKVERTAQDRVLQLKAVRLGDWKLVRRYTQLVGPGKHELVALGDELYDLASDPREERDLAGSAPAGAPLERLRAELARFIAADTALGEHAADLARRHAALDAEARRILGGLGY